MREIRKEVESKEKILLKNKGSICKISLIFICVFSFLIIFASPTNAIIEATSGFGWPLLYTNKNTLSNNEYCSGGWCNNGGNYFGEYDTVSYQYPVYHPGEDWNVPGIPGGYANGCSSDKGLDVVAAANGSVVYANTSDWGGIVIKHIYQGKTWYSQYGHVININAVVTVGQDVEKGDKIAEIGDVDASCAHLHFEIRKANHPNPTFGAYWKYGSKGLGNLTNVNNWYEDPDTFVPAHPAYTVNLLPAPDLISPSNEDINQQTTTVVRVVDGDTLKVRYWGKEESIRLIGIDTPESRVNKKAKKDAKRSGQDIKTITAMGKRATEYVESLVKSGDLITIEFDAQQRDRYGKLLGYIYLSNGKILNEEIIKAGYANVMTIPPNVKYQNRFLRTYQEAREIKREMCR